MTNSAAVDNDVLIKLACYRLLCDVLAVFGGSGSVGILGAARFVVTNNIRRSSGINDQESALQDRHGPLTLSCTPASTRPPA